MKFLFLSLCLLSIVSFSQPFSTKKITFKEAADQGLIDLDIHGLFGAEEYTRPDGSGFYYGECMAMDVENLTDSMLQLHMPIGTYLLCLDTSVQNMVVTEQFDWPISAGTAAHIRFNAMCGEIDDYGPMEKDHYVIGDTTEEDIVKLSIAIHRLDRQDHVGQLAMWSVANDAKPEKLFEGDIDSTELQDIYNILDEAKVVAPINEEYVEARLEEERQDSLANVEMIAGDDEPEEEDQGWGLDWLHYTLIVIGSLLGGLLIRRRFNKSDKDL